MAAYEIIPAWKARIETEKNLKSQSDLINEVLAQVQHQINNACSNGVSNSRITTCLDGRGDLVYIRQHVVSVLEQEGYTLRVSSPTGWEQKITFDVSW